MLCEEVVRFPAGLKVLELGEFFDGVGLGELPEGVEELVLVGERVGNPHVGNVRRGLFR